MINTCCAAIIEKMLADCDEVLRQLFEDEYYDDAEDTAEDIEDIEDIPEEVRTKMNFVVADTMDTVLKTALV